MSGLLAVSGSAGLGSASSSLGDGCPVEERIRGVKRLRCPGGA